MDKDRCSQGYFRCLAALALLAQLLLAAAHVHWVGSHDIRATASASHDSGRTPAGPLHQGDEFCPLCWAQTAAGSLLPPAVIEHRIPANIAAARLTPVSSRLAGRTTPNAFRPRAPPPIICA